MDRRTVARFDLLARGLLLAAAVVLTLSVISAIAISTSDNSLPFFEDLQRESRGIAAIVTFGGGLAAAGVMAGMGAILQLLLIDRATRAGPEPEPEELEPEEDERELSRAVEAERARAPRERRTRLPTGTKKRPRER